MQKTIFGKDCTQHSVLKTALRNRKMRHFRQKLLLLVYLLSQVKILWWKMFALHHSEMYSTGGSLRVFGNFLELKQVRSNYCVFADQPLVPSINLYYYFSES